MAYLLRRGLFRHVLSPNARLYSEKGINCCCASTTNGFTSWALNTRTFGNGILKEKDLMTHRLTTIPFKHFHISAYLDAELAEKSQVQEKYGKESVSVPLPFTRNKEIRYLQNSLARLSLEHKFGFVINRKGKDPNIQLYAKSKQVVESMKEKLSGLIDGKKKQMDSMKFQKRVQCPYVEKEIPSTVVMNAISIDELKDLANKNDCNFTLLSNTKPQGVMLYSSDQTKLEETAKSVEEYLAKTLKTLQMGATTSLPIPEEIPKELDPTQFLPDILEKFRKENVHVRMLRGDEEDAVFKIFADTKETAEKVKKEIVTSVQEKLKAFQDQHKEDIEIPSHPGKNFWFYLRSVVLKNVKRGNPGVTFHLNLREVKRKDPNAVCPTRCLIVGDNQNNVKKAREELKLMMDNYQM
ncbi:uncharacterized protein LOC134264158 [Saccostrea cucullata]|uniref:uncharacterized protein LOC134264158 n=1 Tax=Saccostrea cuccullata TaxID=36930 RepID=UPI002ED2E06A